MTGEHPSPWRNPLLWLIVGLPALAVVGGIAMLFVAGRTGGTSDSVADPVRRTGQVQVATLDADARARAAGLRVVLRVQDGVVEALPAKGTFDRAQSLSLAFHHPSHAERDVPLALAPTETGWRAERELDAGTHWNVELRAPGDAWRLQGRLGKGEHAVLLQPALPEP